MSDKKVRNEEISITNIRLKNEVLSNTFKNDYNDGKYDLELELEKKDEEIVGFAHSLNGSYKQKNYKQYQFQDQGLNGVQVFFGQLAMTAEMFKDAVFDYEVVKLESSIECQDMSKSSEQTISEYSEEERFCDSMK